MPRRAGDWKLQGIRRGDVAVTVHRFPLDSALPPDWLRRHAGASSELSKMPVLQVEGNGGRGIERCRSSLVRAGWFRIKLPCPNLLAGDYRMDAVAEKGDLVVELRLMLYGKTW